MARPKKAPVKVPVKRTRRPKEVSTAHVGPTPIPEIWIDQNLRKECLQIAANNGSSISTLVKDAEGLYYFIKGVETISLAGLREKISTPQPEPIPKPYVGLSAPSEEEPEMAATYSPKSKFDAHTL